MLKCHSNPLRGRHRSHNTTLTIIHIYNFTSKCQHLDIMQYIVTVIYSSDTVYTVKIKLLWLGLVFGLHIGFGLGIGLGNRNR